MISPFSDYYKKGTRFFPECTIDQELFTPEFRIPTCYINEKAPKLGSVAVNMFSDKVLFYIFYNMHHERAQVDSAKALQQHGWTYDETSLIWLKK